MKKCSRCGEEKPLTAYYFETRRGKKTPRAKCKTCHKAAVYARRAEDPERAKEIDARYREKNREKLLAKQRKWWARNGEKHNAARRQARKENPEHFRALERAWHHANKNSERVRSRIDTENALRYALRKGRPVGDIRVERIDRMEVFRAFGGACQHCGRELSPAYFHMDHIVALALGGHHVRENVQPLCVSCNCRKGAGLDIRRWKPGQPTPAVRP